MKKYELLIWGPKSKQFIRAALYDTLFEAEKEKEKWLTIGFMTENRVKIVEVEID